MCLSQKMNVAASSREKVNMSSDVLSTADPQDSTVGVAVDVGNCAVNPHDSPTNSAANNYLVESHEGKRLGNKGERGYEKMQVPGVNGEVTSSDVEVNGDATPHCPCSPSTGLQPSCSGAGSVTSESTERNNVDNEDEVTRESIEPAENGCDDKRNGNSQCPMSQAGNLEPGRVFHVLDEYNNSDDEDVDEPAPSSESDISDTEIEAMLETGLNENVKTEKELKNEGGAQYIERKYFSLEELGHNHFDVLPEGWIKIDHKSGMPVYLHKPTRVCTFARPYYLGQGSARRHLVPLSAIPCLQYRRALEEEKLEKEKTEATIPAPVLGVQMPLRTAKIETAEENRASQSLGAFTIMQYCKPLFRFKTAQRLKFVTWPDRRRYAKAKRIEKQNQRPTFPDDTKLIKFPIQNLDDPDSKPKGEWIMNPNGKSYICILHEYIQHALKRQPTYEFKSLENPSTPYSATVMINGMRYGCGTGTSKKQAKLDAARASLEILIPEMREKIRNDASTNGKRPASAVEQDDSLSIFDAIKVEDPRVAEFCAKTTEPLPYAILLTCLQRNFDAKSMPVEYKVNPLHRQTNEFIMTVGQHRARVICKNKKDGKQRASQAILQKLHPYIESWGSLLRLYGNCSMRNVKERKHEEQEITMLQSKASLNSPNYAILEKLKTEMLKIADESSKRKPIGVFIPPSDVPLPSSGTQLNKVDL